MSEKKERFELAKARVMKRFKNAVTAVDSRGKFYVAEGKRRLQFRNSQCTQEGSKLGKVRFN